MQGLVEAEASYAVSDLVLSGFVRIVTHPAIFPNPDPVADAMDFASALRSAPNAVAIGPGRRHWAIFEDLCRRTGAKGNSVPDAFYAALAIESGSDWVTADRGFARFPGLRWRHPFD